MATVMKEPPALVTEMSAKATGKGSQNSILRFRFMRFWIILAAIASLLAAEELSSFAGVLVVRAIATSAASPKLPPCQHIYVDLGTNVGIQIRKLGRTQNL